MRWPALPPLAALSSLLTPPASPPRSSTPRTLAPSCPRHSSQGLSAPVSRASDIGSSVLRGTAPRRTGLRGSLGECRERGQGLRCWVSGSYASEGTGGCPMQKACHVYICCRCLHLLTVLGLAQFTDVNWYCWASVAKGGTVMVGVWSPVK